MFFLTLKNYPDLFRQLWPPESVSVPPGPSVVVQGPSLELVISKG